jgi:hypothetical protein
VAHKPDPRADRSGAQPTTRHRDTYEHTGLSLLGAEIHGGAPVLKRHDAVSVRIGDSRDADYQRIYGELTKTFELQERFVGVVEDLAFLRGYQEGRLGTNPISLSEMTIRDAPRMLLSADFGQSSGGTQSVRRQPNSPLNKNQTLLTIAHIPRFEITPLL